MNTFEVPEIVKTGIYNSDAVYKAGYLSSKRTTTMFEIEIPISSGGISYVDNESFKVSPNTITCFKPGQKRHTKYPLKTYYLHISVKSGFVFDILSEIPVYFNISEPQKYYDLFSDLISLTGSKDTNKQLLAGAVCLNIIYTLYSDYKHQLTKEAFPSASRKAIEDTLDFINNNLSESLSLESLAKRASYSTFHFHKAFKAYTGKTLREYIESKRFQKACELLTSTSMTLTEIGLECGFSSGAYFSASFKRKYKMTPRDYVKKRNLKYEY